MSHLVKYMHIVIHFWWIILWHFIFLWDTIQENIFEKPKGGIKIVICLVISSWGTWVLTYVLMLNLKEPMRGWELTSALKMAEQGENRSDLIIQMKPFLECCWSKSLVTTAITMLYMWINSIVCVFCRTLSCHGTTTSDLVRGLCVLTCLSQ